MQEPEAGLEPAGPDQSLPVSAEPNPPPERKVTSYINVSCNQYIKDAPPGTDLGLIFFIIYHILT